MASRAVVTDEPLNASTPLPALVHDVTPISAHYVRNHFPIPDLAPDAWRLQVGGAVATPLSLDLDTLQAYTPRTLTVTLACAGNGRTRMHPRPPGTPWDDGAISTQRWTGARLVDVMREAAPADDVVEVLFRGADRGVEGGREMAYERSLPLVDARGEDVLLAYEMDGAPLPPEHGAPVRLLVPGWYGMASVKWLTDVECLTSPFEGWFQTDRYVYVDGGQSGPVTRMKVTSLIATPSDGTTIPAGDAVTVRGRAASGHGRIEEVRVSTDAGRTWERAELDDDLGPHAWCGFRWTWVAPEAGEHLLLARAKDTAGYTQPLRSPWNRYGYGNNSVVPVRVRVE